MKYVFEYDEHDEYGFWGLRPLWLEGSDPATGMQAAHDILEHFNEPITSESELMALGAMLHVRADGGYFNYRYNNDISSILSGDLEFAVEQQWKYGDISDPGVTRPVDDHIESWITKSIASAIQTMSDDDWEDSYGNLIQDNPMLALHLRGWLRMGYRRARRRFGKQDSLELATAFKILEEQLDDALKKCDIGYRVEVNLTLGNLLQNPIRVSLVEPNWIYDEDY